MGMYDNYEPLDANCPACGSPMGEWQGKDSICYLGTWEQRSVTVYPNDAPPTRLERIYGYCVGPDKHWVEAEAVVYWVATRIVSVDDKPWQPVDREATE